MYTDGLNSVHLTGEGVRYFVSSNTSSCKDGLKLHVDVLPREISKAVLDSDSDSDAVRAPGPVTPSGSARVGVSMVLVVAGFGLWFVGL
ncbi:hypothetical protein LINPERHAP1_LOCUS3599 [Linum perenne]